MLPHRRNQGTNPEEVLFLHQGDLENRARALDLDTDFTDYHARQKCVSTFLSRSPTRVTYPRYWRKVVRIAGLVHDVGHPPFSHAAEKELFPSGFDHESMTRLLLTSPEMCNIRTNLPPPVHVDDIPKVAIGPKKLGQNLRGGRSSSGCNISKSFVRISHRGDVGPAAVFYRVI